MVRAEYLRRAGLSPSMATIILTAVIIAIVIAASLWSGGLSSIFTRNEEVEVKNSYITSRDGKNTVNIKYENVGSTETSVESVQINGVPYTEYTPTPQLGGDLGSLPSTCETGVPKEGTITFVNGATDRSGNKLTSGAALIITLSTRNGRSFQASMVIPDAGSANTTINESSDIEPTINSTSDTTKPLLKTNNETMFRLGAHLASSSVMGFGKRHGVNIGLDYPGGQTFYNYMTRGPAYFAHIDFAIRLFSTYSWGGESKFIQGLLDAADADGGRCEISISVYGLDLGWPGFWESKLIELLDTIGPNRPSMRFIFLKGEWTYKNMVPPTYDELKKDFMTAKGMVASYGYELGWFGEAGYMANIPHELWCDVWSWGPRVKISPVAKDQDPVIGVQHCYENAFAPQESPTDVLMAATTMWDDPSNTPGVAPYYTTYEKYDAILRGAQDRYNATGGVYPQTVFFYITPATTNDVEGVTCPYLTWLADLAEKYDVRTSLSDPIPVPKAPPVPSPPSPFPPYPTISHWEPAEQSLPPFMAEVGGTFDGVLYAKNAHLWQGLGNREFEVYLVKQTLKGTNLWDAYPISKEQWASRILVGKVITAIDGRGPASLKTPLEPGRYAITVHIPQTGQEMESFSDLLEFVLVTERVHRVEIRSNVKIMVALGPSEYGPSWGGVDPNRWVEPNKSVWGWCGEMSWTFIVPPQVSDDQGRTWKFNCWEDGSTDPIRKVYVANDYVIEAYYELEN